MPLLSKEFIKSFFAFLENASEAELREKRQDLEQLLDQVTDREFRQKVQWLIREVNDELLTRLVLK